MIKLVLVSLLLLSSSLMGEIIKSKNNAKDKTYLLAPSLAVIGGFSSLSNLKNSDVYGLEFAVAFALSKRSSLFIKQQISLTYQTQDNLSITSLEFNPYLYGKLFGDFTLGFGPGFSIVFTDGEKSDAALGVSLGLAVNYNITHSFFVGLESRYQWINSIEFIKDQSQSINNLRTMAKLGMRF